MMTGHRGHRFVRFDTEHPKASLDERSCHLAGPAPDVQDVSRTQRDQIVDEISGVRRTQSVILLRDQSECLGPAPVTV
jgi:hypothetical protein